MIYLDPDYIFRLSPTLLIFAVENRIHIRKSNYSPGSTETDQIIEHELTHVQQYSEGRANESVWGALQGEYNENPTGMEILIYMGLNFIPFVGQACDVRDITACLKKLVIEKRVDDIMILVTLLLPAIGCIPCNC